MKRVFAIGKITGKRPRRQRETKCVYPGTNTVTKLIAIGAIRLFCPVN